MRLINYVYTGFTGLENFIQTHNIPDDNSVLIQLFHSNENINNVYSVKQHLKILLPNVSMISASTSGVINNGAILDRFITLSFSIFTHSTTKSKSYCHIDLKTLIDRLDKDLITTKTKLLLCFANTFTFNSEEFLKKVTAKFPNLIIAGGNGADDFKFEKCTIFSQSCDSCDVAFAAIDSDILEVQSKYLLNWHTIGKEHTVTKSNGNQIFELDNKKIIDVYEYYLGKDVASNILLYGTEFPLIFNDQGIDVARAPIVVHADNSLTFAGEIPQGTKVKFGYADVEFIEDYNKDKLLNEYEYKNEAVYIYTCSARRGMLGKYLSDEMSIINSIGPTSGFVTYGEFFHDKTSCSNNLLNITTTYLILNEEPSNELIEKTNHNPLQKNKKDVTLKALTTLISRTSDELDEKNYYLKQFKDAISQVAIFSATDEKGKILYVNKNFENISGYTSDELIGKSHNIVRSEDVPKETFKEMWETIKSGQIWKGILKNISKSGKPYYVLSEISPIYKKDGTLKEYIGIRNDVTELEEYKHILKNELDLSNQNYEENLNYTRQYEDAINKTTAIVKTDTNNIIKYVNQRFCELSGYHLGEVIGKNCKEMRSFKHQDEKKCNEIAKKLNKREIVHERLTNQTKDGLEYTVENLFYPIINLEGEVVEYLQIMYDLTEIITLNEEITNTQKEVVLTMGAIGETRSKETGLHVKRVAEYSYLLAKLAGLDEETASLLKQASPMHDIGKVGIPDEILNKPAKLTPEEFEIMKTHAEIGYEMLKHSKRDILKASSIVAISHHEKWDGNGYPNQLAGEDIHIFGRITAIADVFDALGHDRIYKKAWILEDILELFRKEKGKHFDPKLIDLFFENLDKFLEIRDSMQDNF
jgi:PAS domain S-box-containing protein